MLETVIYLAVSSNLWFNFSQFPLNNIDKYFQNLSMYWCYFLLKWNVSNERKNEVSNKNQENAYYKCTFLYLSTLFLLANGFKPLLLSPER